MRCYCFHAIVVALIIGAASVQACGSLEGGGASDTLGAQLNACGEGDEMIAGEDSLTLNCDGEVFVGNDVTLRGQGVVSTLIRCGDGATSVIVIGDGGSSNPGVITFKDLTIDVTSLNDTGDAFVLHSESTLTFHNVKIVCGARTENFVVFLSEDSNLVLSTVSLMGDGGRLGRLFSASGSSRFDAANVDVSNMHVDYLFHIETAGGFDMRNVSVATIHAEESVVHVELSPTRGAVLTGVVLDGVTTTAASGAIVHVENGNVAMRNVMIAAATGSVGVRVVSALTNLDNVYVLNASSLTSGVVILAAGDGSSLTSVLVSPPTSSALSFDCLGGCTLEKSYLQVSEGAATVFHIPSGSVDVSGTTMCNYADNSLAYKLSAGVINHDRNGNVATAVSDCIDADIPIPNCCPGEIVSPCVFPLCATSSCGGNICIAGDNVHGPCVSGTVCVPTSSFNATANATTTSATSPASSSSSTSSSTATTSGSSGSGSGNSTHSNNATTTTATATSSTATTSGSSSSNGTATSSSSNGTVTGSSSNGTAATTSGSGGSGSNNNTASPTASGSVSESATSSTGSSSSSGGEGGGSEDTTQVSTSSSRVNQGLLTSDVPTTEAGNLVGAITGSASGDIGLYSATGAVFALICLFLLLKIFCCKKQTTVIVKGGRRRRRVRPKTSGEWSDDDGGSAYEMDGGAGEWSAERESVRESASVGGSGGSQDPLF